MGLINTLTAKHEKETEKVFYALPKKGINSVYSETPSTLERLYFNIHVGLALMLEVLKNEIFNNDIRLNIIQGFVGTIAKLSF